MAETMIERVARAMIAKDSGPEGSTLFKIHMQEFGDGYRESARAAIEAMREPTEAMVESCGSGECGKWAPGAWGSMIDAALKETN